MTTLKDKFINERIDGLNKMWKEVCESVYSQAWNAAIEAAAEEADSKSHILLPLSIRIRKLKS